MPLSQGPWINSELWANGLAEWKVRDYDLAVLSKHTAFSGLPDGSAGKESACNAGNTGLIPGLGRSPREGNGNPLQYSCLENPTNRGAWQATVRGLQRQDLPAKHSARTVTGRGSRAARISPAPNKPSCRLEKARPSVSPGFFISPLFHLKWKG